MKCLSCYEEIDDGAARCPICGFPALLTTEDTKEAEAARRSLGEAYRRKKLSGIALRINTYMYRYEAGHLSTAEKKEIILANAADLKAGEILWHEQKFGTAAAETVMTLPVVLTLGERRRPVIVKVRVPEVGGFYHIGVALDDGLAAHIVIGNREHYGSSKVFSLIRQQE